MSDETPLDSPGLLEVLTAARDLFAANEQVRLAVARHLGLSINEIVALTHLQTHGPMTQRELADGLGMTPSAVTVMIDRLLPRGLVTKERHPHDRRRTLVGVHTPSEDPMGLFAVLGRPVLAMAPEDRHQAARLLTELAGHLSAAAVAVGGLEPVAPARRRLT